jgi:hypothetical protein
MSSGKPHVIDYKGKDYVTHAGLVDEVHTTEQYPDFLGIETVMLQAPTTDNGFSCIFRATVKVKGQTFTGHGECNPKNAGGVAASRSVEMAETRSINRALRLATNNAEVTYEELDRSDNGHHSVDKRPTESTPKPATSALAQRIAEMPSPTINDLSAIVPHGHKAWDDWTALWKKAKDLGHPNPPVLKVGATTRGELMEEGKALRAWVADFEAKIPA